MGFQGPLVRVCQSLAVVQGLTCYLRMIHATWADVASALQHAGLSPADILRAVLPLREDSSDLWNVLQVAVCFGPEDADYREARGVLGYYGVEVEQIWDTVLIPENLKAVATQRLLNEQEMSK